MLQRSEEPLKRFHAKRGPVMINLELTSASDRKAPLTLIRDGPVRRGKIAEAEARFG